MTDKIAEVFSRLEAQQIEERVELGPGETSLHFFQKVYRDAQQPMPRRMQAAKEAAPFEHPKLNAVGFIREVETFASRLERAAARSDPNGEYYARFTKQIEAQAVEVKDESSR